MTSSWFYQYSNTTMTHNTGIYYIVPRVCTYSETFALVFNVHIHIFGVHVLDNYYPELINQRTGVCFKGVYMYKQKVKPDN